NNICMLVAKMNKKDLKNKAIKLAKLAHSKNKKISAKFCVSKIKCKKVFLERIGVEDKFQSSNVKCQIKSKMLNVKCQKRRGATNKPVVKISKAKKQKLAEWTILNADNGENFALKNIKNIKRLIELPIEVREVIGLPEAGKTEPWNFIKIDNVDIGNDENSVKDFEYILNDYDTLQKEYSFNDSKRYELNNRNENKPSQYVLNLKKQESENAQVRSQTIEYIVKQFHNSIDGILQFNKNIFKKVLHKIKYILNFSTSKWSYRSFFQSYRKYFKSELAYSTVSFVFMALLVVLPIYGFKYYTKVDNVKARVMGASIEALQEFELGKSLFNPNNIDDAKEKFASAGLSFHFARESLDEINNIGYNLSLKLLNKDEQVDSGRALLEAGEKASEISQFLLDGFASLVAPTETEASVSSVADNQLDSFDISLTELISKFNLYVTEAMPKVDELQKILDKVDIDSIPEDYQDKVKTIKNSIIVIKDKLLSCVKYSDVLIEVFAKDSEKRYLLLFQNNNELRPSGGFIGSYALADIKNGKIINLEMPEQGSYYLQGSLYENIAPPKPLMLINDRWEFQDSNWWPDFPTSAKTISDFYEKSGKSTVDGVIAINASLMEQLLDAIGSIDMPEYSKSVDSNNFIEETQKAVELEYDRVENKPKKFLADLMPKVLDRIFQAEREQFREILYVLNKALI
ncbi:DUF4012 domain-containing protein, partial [Patescibacteria group bacterium]